MYFLQMLVSLFQRTTLKEKVLKTRSEKKMEREREREKVTQDFIQNIDPVT